MPLLCLLAVVGQGCCTEAVLELSQPEVSLVRTEFIGQSCVLRVKNVTGFHDGIYAVDAGDGRGAPQRESAGDDLIAAQDTRIVLRKLQDTVFQSPWESSNVILSRGCGKVLEVTSDSVLLPPPVRDSTGRSRIGVSINKGVDSHVCVEVFLEDQTKQEWERLGMLDCGEGTQSSLRWLAVAPLWPCAVVLDVLTSPFQVGQGCISGSCLGGL
jgi:hypothetical protein